METFFRFYFKKKGRSWSNYGRFGLLLFIGLAMPLITTFFLYVLPLPDMITGWAVLLIIIPMFGGLMIAFVAFVNVATAHVVSFLYCGKLVPGPDPKEEAPRKKAPRMVRPTDMKRLQDIDIDDLTSRAKKVLDQIISTFRSMNAVMGIAFIGLGVCYCIVGGAYQVPALIALIAIGADILRRAFFPMSQFQTTKGGKIFNVVYIAALLLDLAAIIFVSAFWSISVMEFIHGIEWVLLGLFLLIWQRVGPEISKSSPGQFDMKKEMRNIYTWREYLSDPGQKGHNTGKLEQMMNIIGKISSWEGLLLRLQRMYILMLVLFPLIAFVPITVFDNVSWSDLSGLWPFLLFFGAVFAIGNLAAYLRYRARMKFWKPRLEEYNARLERFWEEL